jgi:hypothetical protein
MNPRPVLCALVLTVVAAFAPPTRAQSPAPALPPSSATITTNPAAPQLTEAQLETLLGPVALYPDALIALILPAATAPSDVVLAARFLAAQSDPSRLDTQPWDESVRSLTRYPDVIKWLDENLAWTKQVGEAFVAQPAAVMQAVQRLRARARAAGTLVDTPEQKIVTEGEVILIEPARPDLIYVPRYDPEVVYLTRSPGWSQPYLTFGLGFAAGAWLTYDCDWPGRTIWVGNWRQRPQTVWVRPAFPNRPLRPDHPLPVARPWHPPEPRYGSPRVIGYRPEPVVIYPRPMPGTPPRPPGDRYPRHPGSELPPRVVPGAGFEPTSRPSDGPPGERRRDRPDSPTPRNPNPPASALPTLAPPPATLPPPNFIGAPPANSRRERPEPTRPRSESPREPRSGNEPRTPRSGDEPREPRTRDRDRDPRPAPPPAPTPTAKPSVEPTADLTPR